MYGGTIQNNSAVDGGGVYIAPAGNAYSAGEMTICGDAVIQGNKAGSVLNNVSLPSGKTITISGELGKNANIGVTTRANLSQGNVNIATATDAGWVVAKNFTSDNSAYHVGLVNDGKTVQLQVHSHQWKYTANGDRFLKQLILRILEYQPDALADLYHGNARCSDIHIADEHAPAAWLEQSVQMLQQGRLARSGMSDHTQQLAVRNRKIDILQRDLLGRHPLIVNMC